MKRIKKYLSLMLVLLLTLTVLPADALANDSLQIIPFQYDGAGPFCDGLASVFIGKSWFEGGRRNKGYIDKTGNVVIPLQYDFARDFSEGLACVMIDRKYGYIDTAGNEIIPMIYDYAGDFSDGLARVQMEDGRIAYINTSGKEVIPFREYDDAGSFCEGLASVEFNGMRGYMDKGGNMVISPKYYRAYGFSEGLACVSLFVDGSEKYVFIDKTGKEVTPLIYSHAESFSEGLAEVGIKSGQRYEFGYIDKTGKTIIPIEYSEAEPFSEGMAAVKIQIIKESTANSLTTTTSEYGYIDKTGKTIIPFEYFSAEPFSDGLAVVCEKFGGNYGCLDKTGKLVIPYSYREIESYSEGLAAVSDDAGKWGYITMPEVDSAPTHALDTASIWAQSDIAESVEKGFVPADIQGSYTNTITRAEFCRLAVQWVEYATRKDIDTLLSQKGLTRNQNAFSDTKDPVILAAYALGITNGTTAPSTSAPGTFTPNGQFTREQAATMIMNTCGAIGADVSNPPNIYFKDIKTASDWAVNGIHFVGMNGVMRGTDQFIFSPKLLYTREQAIVTFFRITPWFLPLPAPAVPQSSGASAFEWEVFERVNMVREFYELTPLIWHTELGNVARAHSTDMKQRDYYSHTSLDGSTFDNRIDAAGILWEYCGENIAHGQDTPKSVFTAWMNSTPHRENILSENYTHIGVGFCDNYWTQNFIRQ